MEASPGMVAHPSEEALEAYSLGRLHGAALCQLERHLAACQGCWSRLAEFDTYLDSLKAVLHEFEEPLRLRPAPRRRWWAPWPETGLGLSASGRGAFALAALIALGVSGSYLRPGARSPGGPDRSEVTLTATRGESVETVLRPSTGGVLVLNLDRNALPENDGYRVEIADSKGLSVWTGFPAVAGGKLSAVVTSPLAAGVYWVRLFSVPEPMGDRPRSVHDAPSELLREFGLRLK